MSECVLRVFVRVRVRGRVDRLQSMTFISLFVWKGGRRRGEHLALGAD